MREFAGAMFFNGSGLSKVRFFRGLVCQDSGFKVGPGVSVLLFSEVWCFRVLCLQGSGFTGVRYVRGQVFPGSVFSEFRFFQGSHFSGVKSGFQVFMG